MCMTCICMLILCNMLMAVDTDENPFASDDEESDTDNKSYDESGMQTLSLWYYNLPACSVSVVGMADGYFSKNIC